MYYQMFPRMSLETGEQLSSPAVSAEDQSVLVGSLTAYNLSGTSPAVAVAIQTSDDGEVWSSVGTILTATTVGITFGTFQIVSNQWGRLVRAQAVVSGTNGVAEFALGLQTLLSS